MMILSIIEIIMINNDNE